MKTKYMTTVLMLMTLAIVTKAAPPEEEGKNIFVTRCAACHSVNKVLTGPALAGVDQRRSIDWIINFVRSSQSLVKSGDKYAVELFEKFNKVPMPDHPDLTEENIKSIVAYIKSQADGINEKPPFAKPSKKMIPYLPLSIQKDYGFFIGFLSVVTVLVLALLFAVQSSGFQRKMRGKEISA